MAIDSSYGFIAPSDRNTFDSCGIAVKMSLDSAIDGVNQDPWTGNTFFNCDWAIYVDQLHEWFGPNSLRIRNNTFIGQGTDIEICEPGTYYFPDNTFLETEGKARSPRSYEGEGVVINFGAIPTDASDNRVEIAIPKDSNVITVSGAVSASAPVLIASYGEDGSFLGLSTVTAPSEKAGAEEGAQTVKVLWIDAAGFAPKTGTAEFSLK